MVQIKTVLSTFCLLSLSLLIDTHHLTAQVADTSYAVDLKEIRRVERAFSIYLDCPQCDYNYLREQLNFVNYVRDPLLADLHVFVTGIRTTGGREFNLSFIGRRGFSNIQYDLTYLASRNNSTDETRQGMIRAMKAGLMPFINQSPLAQQFSIEYESNGNEEEVFFSEHDPWDFWIFEVYLGNISLGLESNQTNFNSRWGLVVDRVTEEWKFRITPYFNYSLREIRQDDRDNIRRTVKRHGVDTHALKSINDHWSVGVFGSYLTRNDQNLKHQYQLSPAVEYSLLPYELATRRAITLTYYLGYNYSSYFEKTIFGKMQEDLLNHNLQASVNIRQPWGNLYGNMQGSHYFHDADLRRFGLSGGSSFRLTKGLSLNLNTNFQMIQDQITLPAGDTSLEDILLQQRQLATNFTFSGSIGISYKFGSEFANIVNTRF
jgi:hypothetical protein